MTRSLLYLACFLSGASALVYEVVWTRVLTRQLGHTTASVATVLSVFMGGLALGAWLATRWLPRLRSATRAYALVEIGILVSGPLVVYLGPLFDPLLRALYRVEALSGAPFHAARLLAAAVMLLVPTTLMGSTLVLLVHAVVPGTEVLGRFVGRLYAINTLGASLGALLAGFLLLPWLGIDASLWVAAGGNLAAAVLAFAAGGRGVSTQPVAEKPSARAPLDRIGVLATVAAAGAIAMVLQVAWSRFLSLTFGATHASFAVTVSAFIVGLAIGGWAFGRLADRVARPREAFGWLLALGGAGTLVVTLLLPVLGELAGTIVVRFRWSYPLYQAAACGATFLALLAATVPLGGVFPFAVKCFSLTGDAPGLAGPACWRATGVVYAWNCAGAVVGPAAGGLLLLPALGLRGTLVAASAAYFALAGLTLAGAPIPFARKALAAALLTAAVGGAPACVPAWSGLLLVQAPHLYARPEEAKSEWKDPLVSQRSEEECLAWLRESSAAVVSVHVSDTGQRVLRVNGKTDASSGTHDMRTQVLLAHLPMLASRSGGGSPGQDALVIGLGSGVTAGCLLSWEGVQVDCVEIAPPVAEAARRYFAPENHGALSDPRLRVIFDDGRTYVSYASKQYDVIVSEPSNAWYSGMSDLFSVEFYSRCRARLRRGGVMAQWLHAYILPVETFRSLACSFRQVFPEATLWETYPGKDYILISRGGIEPAVAQEAWGRPRVREDLERVGFREAGQWACHWVLDAERLGEFCRGAVPQRDAHPRAEFEGPRALFRPEGSSVLGALDPLRRSFRSPIPDVEEARAARAELIRVQITPMLSYAERLPLQEALLPRDPIAEVVMGQAILDCTGGLLQAGHIGESERIALSALALVDGLPLTHSDGFPVALARVL